MNYEALSDTELNQSLACLVYDLDGWELSDSGGSFYHCGVEGEATYVQPVPVYCTDWGETMPLAIEHGITTLSCGDSYEVSYDYEAPTGSYGCGEILSSHIDAEKSGVLRAIVICLINKLESE